MSTKYQELKWKLFQKKSRALLIYGLKKGYIAPYDEELIEKLRTIYHGGIPASILLIYSISKSTPSTKPSIVPVGFFSVPS